MSATGRGSDTAAKNLPDSLQVESGKAKKRSGSRGRRRALETAEREIREIRNEANPLARRHMPIEERHVAPDELAARDWTRPLRVEGVAADIAAAYRLKRGEAR